jgi:hypothetical protein
MTCTDTCVRPSPSQAHCSSCHITLSGVTGFDAHRRGGRCLDPATITKDGGMRLDWNGIWRWNGRTPNPHARSARERAPQTAARTPLVARDVLAPSEPSQTLYGGLEREHDRLMNERARLVLDGVDPAELALPISPLDPERRETR